MGGCYGVTRDPNTVIRRPGEGGGGGLFEIYCSTFPLVNIIRASEQSSLLVNTCSFTKLN